MFVSHFWLGAGAMLAAEFALLFVTVMIMAIIRAVKTYGHDDQDGHDQTGDAK